MARFYGDNDMESLIDLTYERLNYHKYAFPERNGAGPPGVKNYNIFEWGKFGRIDFEGDAIIVNPNSLKPLALANGDTYTLTAQNFVSDAFSDMRMHIRKSITLGTIRQNHPYIVPMSAKNAYTPPATLYDEYIMSIFDHYNETFLADKYYNIRVHTYSEYMKYLPVFMQTLGPEQPMTITGWQRSKNSSIYTSGLAIDIAGLSIASDQEKDEQFLMTEEFSYYLKLVKNYGFTINKNAPFMIVFDLASPASKKYLNNYNYVSPADVLVSNFSKAYIYDIQRLKNAILMGYNKFALKYSYSRDIDVCSGTKTLYKIKKRFPTNADAINQLHNNNHYYNLYIDIRNVEEDYPFKEADIIRLKQKAFFFAKKLGPMSALGYINEQYRSLYASKEGTWNSFNKRMLERKRIND